MQRMRMPRRLGEYAPIERLRVRQPPALMQLHRPRHALGYRRRLVHLSPAWRFSLCRQAWSTVDLPKPCKIAASQPVIKVRGNGMAEASCTRASLLVRIRDPHDHEAWRQFVAIYAPLIHGFARSRGVQDADAADLTQEV